MTEPRAETIFPAVNPTPHAIRRARKARQLSMREAAARAGISHVALGKIERGEVDVRLGTLRALAKALNVPVVALVAPETRKRRRTC